MCRVFTCILAFLLVNEVISEGPEIEIPQGRLKGGIRVNREGGSYYSFQKIPFGVPPVEELRFKASEPAEGWDGVLDATQDLPKCIQTNTEDIDDVEGQEDCLYLNVYTPTIPDEGQFLKPVMVFIYGGAFLTGSAVESSHGAQFLLTKDVVLVLANYRVGIFGFLSLDDPDLGVTGNAGLKDQVLALKWVNSNIKYFGGDPNNVLIFGVSAGSTSVHYHILSPTSKGLFHKAISESGVAITDIAKSEFRNTGEMIAKELGIQTENWSNMLSSLRNVSAQLLSTITQNLTNTHEFFCRPIVEIASKEVTFLEEEAIDIIRSGNYNHVPYMLGFNSAEGLLFERMSIESTGESILITDFTKFIPKNLEIEPDSEEEKIVSQRIKEFYYGESEPTRDNITGAVNLEGDFAFGFPACRAALEHVQNALNPIYFYYFNMDTRLNVAKSLIGEYPGASHGDEQYYLFNSTSSPTDIEEGSLEDLAIKSMVNLWTNFAIYDNPTPAIYREFEWEPVQKNQLNYLRLNTEEIYMDTDPEPERMQFWWDLYEEYYQRN